MDVCFPRAQLLAAVGQGGEAARKTLAVGVQIVGWAAKVGLSLPVDAEQTVVVQSRYKYHFLTAKRLTDTGIESFTESEESHQCKAEHNANCGLVESHFDENVARKRCSSGRSLGLCMRRVAPCLTIVRTITGHVLTKKMLAEYRVVLQNRIENTIVLPNANEKKQNTCASV